MSLQAAPRSRPGDNGTTADGMKTYVSKELLRWTLGADALPVRHCHLTHQNGLYKPWQKAVNPPLLHQQVGESAWSSLGWALWR